MQDRFSRVGQKIGDYRLLKGLGRGTFGDVYLGEHVHEHTLVAVKILHTHLTRSEELKEFINEARTFRLKHPHIVSLLDFGIDSDDVPFLVMEYASQGSLRTRHTKGTRLSLETVVAYITPIASALQYAHDHRLIHRDVKPENILIGEQNVILLSDFGIVSVAHSSHSLNADRGIGGTLPYMAPEQITGRPRFASDQYALGILVYEWLCGTRPFRGTAVELMMQHRMASPPSLREHVPTLPDEVEQVVLKALSKDPKQRFAHVQEFAHALETANQSKNVTTQQREFNSVPSTTAQASFFSAKPLLEPPPTQKKNNYTDRNTTSSNLLKKAITLACICILLIGSTGIIYTTVKTSTADTQATATIQAPVAATAQVLRQEMDAATAYDQFVAKNGTMFGFDVQHTHGNPYERILNLKNVSGLTKKWMYKTENAVFSSPVIVNGVVYIGSIDESLYALDAATGTKKWTYQTGGTIFSSLAVVNGVVYVGSDDGNLYAFGLPNVPFYA